VERPLIQNLKIELMDVRLLELSKGDYSSMTMMPTKDFWEIGLNITCVGFLLSNEQINPFKQVYHAPRVKAWLGYTKGLLHFIFTKPPHLNMLKFNDTFILKV
jgi:hypothetical protein